MPDIRLRRNFTDAFKAEAVRLVEASGKRVSEVARDLYIEVFYNRQRRHSTLGYRSPAAFEAMRQGA